MRRISMFSLMAVLTAALVLCSTPVSAEDQPKCPKEAVCKTATKTVGGTPYNPEATLAPVPEKPTKEASAEPAKPVPAPEKKEPAAAGALVVKAKPAEKPEPKPAPAATPKADEPKGSTPPTPKKPEEPPAATAPPSVAGDPDEEMILIRPKDIAAGVKAASDEGFNAGYAEGVTKSKRYRVMTREEVIEMGLKTAREVIEKRLGPKPAKP